jgi:hypothetical protein
VRPSWRASVEQSGDQETIVAGDGSFVIWIVLAAVPVGLLLISLWSRAPAPGERHVRDLAREKKPEEP